MFTLPDLPYAYNALEPFIDEATMKVHHDGHHATYVKNLNDLVGETTRTLEELANDPNPKIKNNAGGVLNHNFFWTIMSTFDSAQGVPPETFKSIVEPFTTAALGVFGSGWTWLTADLKIITTANQDVPKESAQGRSASGGRVILGLDLWEHAYYLKYQNKRKDYIAAWWNVVNWKQVEQNLQKTS